MSKATYIYITLHIYVYTYMYMSKYTCIYMSIYLYECVFACIHTHARTTDADDNIYLDSRATACILQMNLQCTQIHMYIIDAWRLADHYRSRTHFSTDVEYSRIHRIDGESNLHRCRIQYSTSAYNTENCVLHRCRIQKIVRDFPSILRTPRLFCVLYISVEYIRTRCRIQ